MAPLELLDKILVENAPGSHVQITEAQAEALASLGKRSLGDLWDAVEELGICKALETYGLFGRNIKVVRS